MRKRQLSGRQTALFVGQGALFEATAVDLADVRASRIFIAINWLVYIFSVSHSRILESSRWYYINPLVRVLFGIVLLGERLEPLMKAAVVVAAAGVAWMAIDLGQLPWISLVLAVLVTTLGGNAIGNILFSVNPHDPVIFTAVATLATLVALVATLVPARRATRVDPMTALRSE